METTSGGRLSLYRVLKPSPGTEPYVAANLQYAAWRVMAGLRMGCLPLEVERGRYTQTPYERRTCKLCSMDVEDQRHFISAQHCSRNGTCFLKQSRTSIVPLTLCPWTLTRKSYTCWPPRPIHLYIIKKII